MKKKTMLDINIAAVVINITTSLFAFMPIVNLYNRGRKYGCLLLVCSFISSCLMHITDASHDLESLTTHKYSKWFLIIDRLFTFVVFIYTLYIFHRIEHQASTGSTQINIGIPLLILFAGPIFLIAGEISSNSWMYLFFHSISHYAFFNSLYGISKLLDRYNANSDVV